MGFVAGTSFIRYSPFYQSTPSTAQSSPWPLQQQAFSFTKSRNSISRRKETGTVACLQQENPKDGIFCKKRVILFMGLAVMPLLNMSAEAAEQLSAENADIRILDQEPKSEENPSQNPLLSVLNVLGILGSGVLAPLYLSIKKEKDASDATVESITAKLKEKQVDITFLAKKFESDLSNVKDVGNNALAKTNEEKQSLFSQIHLSNQAIASLKQDLQKERRLAEERNIQLEQLQVSLRKAREEKNEAQQQLEEKVNSVLLSEERVNLLSSEITDKEDVIRNANSEVVEKERELSELRSAYQQSQDQLITLKLEIQELKDTLSRKERELESKNEVLVNLNLDLTSSRANVEESCRKLNSLLNKYDHFKLSAEKKAASDAELLGEREKVLQQLEDQLKVALDAAHKNGVLVTELTKEWNDLAGKLSIELKNVKNLEHELKFMQESWEKSRGETSDLTKQIQLSRDLNSQLEAEISKIQADFGTARYSLERHITEAKQRVEALADELRSAKEQVSKSTEAKQILSQELAAAVKKCSSLEKQLIDAHDRAETDALDLKKEKKIVSSLNNKLKDLEAQISKDKESQKNLETHLQEVTKSLGEMNNNASSFSRELELANTQIASLKDEKEALQDSLDEQKKVFQEARENLEEAHNVVMRIGKERESLQNREKKLEEELASAKGEILRLRTQTSLSVNEVSYQPQQQEVEVGSIKSPVPARRVARRKKVTSQQESS